MKTINHVLILDASGSMIVKRDATIEGITDYVLKLKEAKSNEIENKITIVQFNDHPAFLCLRCPIEHINIDLILSSYNTEGMTALYDAAGITINTLEHIKEDNNYFVINIFTDGEENASKIYNSDKISQMIEKCKKNEWVFNYIGCTNIKSETQKIGIKSTLSYDNSKEGTRQATTLIGLYSLKHMSNIEKGIKIDPDSFFVDQDSTNTDNK